MLPVVRGEAATRRQILIYSVVLVAFTILPYATGLFDAVYLGAAVLLGGGFVALAARLWLRPSRRAAVAVHLGIAGLPGAPVLRDGGGPCRRR